MKTNPLWCIALLVFLSSCVDGANSNPGETVVSGPGKIGEIIDLSHVRIDSSAKATCGIYKMGNDGGRVPGPTDYYLVASFKILSIDTSMLKKINVLDHPRPKTGPDYKPWLPGNVVAAIFSDQGFSPKNIYSASGFAKLSYREGTFMLLPDSTIFLCMQTL